MKPADLGARAVAVLIDSLITFFGLGYSIAALSGQTFNNGGSSGFNLHGGPAIVWIALSWAYWVVLERLWGTTPGKRIFKIRVVGLDGGTISWGQSAGRNLLRVADGFPFVLPYLVGVIVALNNGDKQRLGDRAARTRVVTPL